LRNENPIEGIAMVTGKPGHSGAWRLETGNSRKPPSASVAASSSGSTVILPSRFDGDFPDARCAGEHLVFRVADELASPYR
jgi:hypothetical protein